MFKKVVVTLFIIIIIFSCCTLIYAKSKNISVSVSSLSLILHRPSTKDVDSMNSTKNEINFDPSSGSQFCIYKQHVAWCSKEKLKYLDINGKEQLSMNVNINNFPAMKKAGSYLALADIGGKYLYVMDDNQKKWEAKLENTIINLDISPTGYIAVTHEDMRSKAAISFFDPNGNMLFTTGRSEDYILSAKVSQSGKNMIINTINTSGVKISSTLEFIDSYGKLLNSDSQGSVIFPCLSYMSDDVSIAVGDSSLVCFNKLRKVRWKKDINGRILSYGIIQEKYIAAAVCKEEKNIGGFIDHKCNIIIYNIKNGEEYGNLEIDAVVKQMDVYQDVVAANTGREIYFLNSKGNFLGKCSSKQEISKVCLIDRRDLLMITKSNAKIINGAY